MNVPFEVHDNLAEQPSEIFSELVETSRLCMLLNPKLTKKQVGALTRPFYIVKVEHEGKPRLAVYAGSISSRATRISNRKCAICGTNSQKKRRETNNAKRI